MSSIRIHYLQHVPFEDLGYIETWAKDKNYSLTSTKLYENTTFPDMDEFDMLIIMGGAMSVNDEEIYPWLSQEKKFLKLSIASDKIILGICLGSQLLATALGAKVYPNKMKEIGWYPVYLADTAKGEKILKDFPESISVFHWHGDTFDLPKNSVHLMQSEICTNQAFLYNNKVLGLQFHLETSPETLNSMIENCRDELIPNKYIQTEAEILNKVSQCDITNRYLIEVLNTLTEMNPAIG
ncbi:type 1 glutamine amidotransferase [Bacteroidota bacterium]